jgi:hypothetical protein
MECLLSVSTLATLTLIKLFVEFVETFNNFFNFFSKEQNFFVKENKGSKRIFLFCKHETFEF